VLGLEHPETLTSMNNLAGVLDRQGKYKEAEAMHRQTLAISEKMLRPEHPFRLTSISNLALVVVEILWLITPDLLVVLEELLRDR
jgi:hypothetical protein